MLRTAIPGSIALALIALAFTGRGSAVREPAAALALAPSLAVEECLEVETGDTFTVAISAAGVTNLLAWDIYYAYDRKILEVVGRDVRQFLAEEPNSNVFDLSDPVPNTSGLYRFGAADTGGPGTDEDGSGVLAFLTLRAKDDGVSWSTIYRTDANDDGSFDFGPTLTETGGGHIADADGNGFFDGQLSGGQIAVGRSCKDPAPTPNVPVDILPVPTGNTPVIGTVATPTNRPDGSTPEPDNGSGEAPTRTPGRSATPTDRSGSEPGGGGDGGGGLSPLLAAVAGAIGGGAVIGSYLVFRAVRRPA